MGIIMCFHKLTEDQQELVRQVYANSNYLTYEQCIEHLDKISQVGDRKSPVTGALLFTLLVTKLVN